MKADTVMRGDELLTQLKDLLQQGGLPSSYKLLSCETVQAEDLGLSLTATIRLMNTQVHLRISGDPEDQGHLRFMISFSIPSDLPEAATQHLSQVLSEGLFSFTTFQLQVDGRVVIRCSLPVLDQTMTIQQAVEVLTLLLTRLNDLQVKVAAAILGGRLLQQAEKLGSES